MNENGCPQCYHSDQVIMSQRNRIAALEAEIADLRAHSADLPTDLSCAEEINRDAVKFDKASGSRFLTEGTAAVIIGRHRAAHVAPIRAKVDQAYYLMRDLLSCDVKLCEHCQKRGWEYLTRHEAEKAGSNAN